MNRELFYAEMDGGKNLDYEIYLKTAESCLPARNHSASFATRMNCNFK